MNLYDFEAESIDGRLIKMSEYKEKVVLVVNTASKCGYTKQFKGLEELYQKYSPRGLVIIGFPCNQFGGQDPKSNEEISTFCKMNYGVSFPMFSKIKVNGKEAHPLYQYLKKEKQGILGTEAIKWNFTKFLISKKGDVLERYGSAVTPEELAPIIEKEL